MKLKKKVITISGKINIENINDNICKNDIIDNILGFHLIINNNIIYQKIKCLIKLRSNYFNLVFKDLNLKNTKLFSPISKDIIIDFNILGSINEYILYFEFNDKLTNYINGEIDISSEYLLELFCINIEYININCNINYNINHLVIDKNNHNFDVIFGFNIKYVFDMYRYNLLLYLIEDSEKNINKINNIILNAKKERKINNKNIFIESVLNNLEIESKYSENYSKSGNNLIKLINKSGNVNNKTIINSNRIILKNKNST